MVASGPVRVNGVAAAARDGIAITGESSLTIEAEDGAELVLVDAALGCASLNPRDFARHGGAARGKPRIHSK